MNLELNGILQFKTSLMRK